MILLIFKQLQRGIFAVKRFNGIILYNYISIGGPGGVRARYRAGYQIKPSGHQEQARTVLNRFISAVRSPGAMIDRTERGKLN